MDDWTARVLGRVLGHKYRLEALIGRGGMGAVFRARDVVLDRRVAIKLIQPGRADVAERAERFRREAMAAARVGGDGVIAVIDFDVDPELGPYQVLELLDGESLQARIDRAALSTAEAVAVVLDVARTLGRVHAEGIVHRDIKPANVFLERTAEGRRRVKVLDFGIARVGDAAITSPGTMMGTPGFMAPEQLRGEAIDARTDVYALGVLLDVCVCRRAPFEGLGLGEIAARTVEGSLPSLRARAPHLPEPILAAVEAATRLDPAARPADGNAFAILLEAARRDPRVGADALDRTLPGSAPSVEAALVPFAIPDTGAPIPDASRRRRGLRVAIVLAIAFAAVAPVLAGGAVFLARRSPMPPVAPPALDPAEWLPSASPSTDPRTAEVRAAVGRAEAHHRAGRHAEAVEAFEAVREAAWSLPEGPARYELVARVQVGLGDANRDQIIDAVDTGSNDRCPRARPFIRAAHEAYHALHRLRDDAASQLASLQIGGLYELSGAWCYPGEAYEAGWLGHMRIACSAYRDADREGPQRETARMALRRCREQLVARGHDPDAP